MTNEELIKKLADIDQERNKVIQLLRGKGTPHKEKPIFDVKSEYDKVHAEIINKCGIYKNSSGIYVFTIKTTSLISSQIILGCDYMFINTSSSMPFVVYYKAGESQSAWTFKSKVFNPNTGKFGFDWFSNVKWISHYTYKSLKEKIYY